VTPAFVAVAAATLAFFVAGGVVLPVAVLYVKGPLQASGVEVGLAISIFSISSLLLRPVVGWSADRFGRRPLLLGGSALTICALLLHVVATDLPLFVVARALLGAGEAFFFVAVAAAASDLAPVERRGEAISFLSLFIYLGVAIGPLIGYFVLGGGAYTTVWLVAAGIAALALGLSWVTPETAPTRESEAAKPRWRLFHPAGLFPGFLILTGVWGMAGFLAFVPLHVKEIGMADAAAPLTLFALVVVVLRVVFAKLPDRVGAARLSGSALAVSAAGLAIMGLLGTPAGLLIGTATFAVGTAFTFPALVALAVSRASPHERGMVVGTASVFLDVAFGVAPVVLGAVADLSSFGTAFVLSAAVAALGSALLAARRSTVVRPISEVAA
jgi:MFS family permease